MRRFHSKDFLQLAKKDIRLERGHFIDEASFSGMRHEERLSLIIREYIPGEISCTIVF